MGHPYLFHLLARGMEEEDRLQDQVLAVLSFVVCLYILRDFSDKPMTGAIVQWILVDRGIEATLFFRG